MENDLELQLLSYKKKLERRRIRNQHFLDKYQLMERNHTLSSYGFWSLGYYCSKVSELEDMIDDIDEMINKK